MLTVRAPTLIGWIVSSSIIGNIETNEGGFKKRRRAVRLADASVRSLGCGSHLCAFADKFKQRRSVLVPDLAGVGLYGLVRVDLRSRAERHVGCGDGPSILCRVSGHVSGQLLTAAHNNQFGKFKGIPCDVSEVDRMESHWYLVEIDYGNWGGCKLDEPRALEPQ